MSRSLLIVKPDAVERGLVGEIVSRIEGKGLRLVAVELRRVEVERATELYAEHQGKPFYDALVAFITRSPALFAVVEGPGEDTYRVVRTLMGTTNPKEAPPGTIRGDFGLDMTANLVHGSDSPSSAAREIAIFFPHVS